MSYSHKCNERRYCHQRQQTPQGSGVNNDYDTESAYTYENIKHRYGIHNIPCQKSKHSKDTRCPDLNEIEPHKSHNVKCPVYVHHMQKHYSQNDTYRHSRQLRHQAKVYNCNKWDYYEDRTHYMKNNFDKLTLSNDYDQKHTKSECTRQPCPVHRCSNISKSKKNQSPTIAETRNFDEEVTNKLEESYWAKWKPKCKSHDREIDADEVTMIRTEVDYNRRKACCESERNLPLRCPDCFKCIPDDKDIKCLHKRTATKESKSSDFVKSDYDDVESSLVNENIEKTASSTNGCDCPKSCPGKVKRLSTELLDLPSTAKGTFCEENRLDSKLYENDNCVNEVESEIENCEIPTCPYVVLAKSKKSETQFSNLCNNPLCPYKTIVSLDGQDVEEQLNITQYSNKILPKPGINRNVNADGAPTKQTTKNSKVVPNDTTNEPKKIVQDITHKYIENPTGNVTRAIKTLPNDPMVTGDSKSPNATKQIESPSIPTGPEGTEIPVQLKHTDSFILNSIKQNSLDGKPHYKQPTTIKLSNISKVKGHSYPLKPIMKKEKLLTPRKTLHSPNKVTAANTKSLKTTIKKRL